MPRITIHWQWKMHYLIVPLLVNLTNFDTESSLPSSQQLVTVSYSGPDNSVHGFPSHFFTINFNVILSSRLKSSKLTPYFMSSHQNPACISFLHHTRHTLRPPQPPPFHRPNYIGQRVQAMKLLNMQFSSSVRTLLQVSFKHIFVKITSFIRIPKSMEIFYTTSPS
jgi:hypothetical protein